jgi:O-antigen chain-terminating methyltransferase
MRKIDRIDDEKSAAILALQQDMQSLTRDRIGALDEMIRGLEGIVNNFPRYTDPNPPHVQEISQPLTIPDPSYLLLENRYRGGEAEIERRLSIYPEIFKTAPATVLEMGSGRGELQRLFKKAGVPSYGVDLDTVMVNVANAAGCDTKFGDGIAHLRALPDASLGGLIAIQVVEHLTRSQLMELCELAKRKLKSGSKIVFETINPQSLLALSSNYFRDPTHIWPMHPDTLGYTATLAGLKIVETRYLSPVAPNHLLKEIPVDPNHPPTVVDTVHRINQNIEQLNRLIYGFQDYALILEVA